MSRRWLIVGLVLSLGLHTVVLWPLLAGPSSIEEAVVATESAPEAVDVVAVAMPEPAADAAAVPEPPAPSIPEEAPPAADAEILVTLETAEEEPPAPADRPLEVAPSETEPPAPPTMVAEAESPVEPEVVTAAVDVEMPDAPEQVPDVETAAASAPMPEPAPTRTRSRVAAMLEESPVVVAEEPPVLRTTSRVAAMSEPRTTPPVVVEEASRVPQTTSRTAAMSEPRVAARVSTPRRELPDSAEIQRRIEAASGRTRPSPSAVRSDHDGDHLSTQNGPAKVVPQIEWRSLARWRAVAGASGLRLIALSADGGPAAFVAESGGRWRRNPMPDRLSGYSARVRIVDHVAAFQPVRSCLRPGERLAILVPRSIETLMENSMQEAIRRQSLQPSQVAVCSGVLEPDGAGDVLFRVDRISARRSS